MTIKIPTKSIKEIIPSEDGDFLEFVFAIDDEPEIEKPHGEMYPAGLWIHKAFSIVISPDLTTISL